MLLVFDLDLDRQPRLHRTVNLLLTSSTSTSTFASTSGFGVTGGFLVRQSAVQDVMTGINDESTTLSTKSEFYAHQLLQLAMRRDRSNSRMGMMERKWGSTPTIVLFFVFSLFG
ncbi:BZ3500_MvSof-1268-A1-R1_Chr1-3g02166 [Microbotryum saponariae]|uniref:BZ3500_MvSof-1268-A1-R1_Chr1-3g02166 protein n=1 Tax=Microbotryum saponariae TaxID=289078 RepID=A0A2X0L4V8_9BASI|nr:BZ3500_MvSof-1268-A1-R1_Chr1-3g02166 [Microbotryum saponariae]SCZ95552.1 BZ3501_MvSof-1269-A2-R1_Chr1-3g01769 [Microbotryum saponariae]